MLEDSSKTTRSRLEWNEDVRGFLHHIDDHLGRGVRGRPPIRLGLVRTYGSTLIEERIPERAPSSDRLCGIGNNVVCRAEERLGEPS